VDQDERVVFVVDDDPSVRKSVARLLRVAGYRTETFVSAVDFLERDRDSIGGCVVLDMHLPELSGLDAQVKLAESQPLLPIVFISGYGDVPTSVQAMKAGAVDFLSKPFSAEDLLGAVREAFARNARERSSRFEMDEIRGRLSALTPREYDVFREVVTGQLNKQVAATLGIREKTVKVHRARVMQKMSAASLADLVRMAERANTGSDALRAGSPVSEECRP
jgi:FixJ family two-component response regulator